MLTLASMQYNSHLKLNEVLSHVLGLVADEPSCTRIDVSWSSHTGDALPYIVCHASSERGLWHAQGGAGSVLPVSVQDCEVACEMAQPQCTSFSYNPTLTACFLKQGGTRATCNSPNTPCYEANQNLQVLSSPVHDSQADAQCSSCSLPLPGTSILCMQFDRHQGLS